MVFCLAIATVVAAQFEILRHTVDSGGVMRSTGGVFELSGTIGQPDPGTLAAGNFELTGGFWFQIPPTDCNEDGGVNLFDHSSFIDCLTGPGGGMLTACECFDTDRSGTVDLLEFAEIQTAFSGR